MNNINTTWVIAAGMRRAGSTLQYHLARELIEHAKGHAAGFVTWQKFEEVYNEFDGKFPYVLLKCHAYLPELVPLADKILKEGRMKVLYIYRDLRDVAASTLQLGVYTWDYIIEEEIPSILHEDKMWMSLEDRKSNTFRTLRYESSIPFGWESQCIAHLADMMIDFSIDMDILRQMASKHTLQAHQELLTKQGEGFDHNSLMWKNHINDGAVGKYKTVLTPEQITQVETLTHDWLRERGYNDIGVAPT